MDLKQIRSLAERDRYDEALSECDKLLAGQEGVDGTDVLRTRAYIHSLRGDYGQALHDRKTIISDREATIRDYYQAGESALCAGEFAQATTWLEEVLRQSALHRETWFTDAAYFLLAFAEMNLGQFSRAEAALDRAVAIQPDIAMPLPHMCGLLGHEQLREEIRTRRSREQSGRP